MRNKFDFFNQFISNLNLTLLTRDVQLDLIVITKYNHNNVINCEKLKIGTILKRS